MKTDLTHPRSAFGAPLQGGAASGPAKPDPQRLLGADTEAGEGSERAWLSVADALAGKRVLLTGATGFVAKVVLEKLIRELPGLGGISLLLRGSEAHAGAEQRFRAEVLSSSVFDRLRSTEPQRLADALARLRFVTGDIAAPQLGLSRLAFEDLAQGVDVIINVAASVDFREELDRALDVNALALLSLTRLARLAGGAPLIQVSTCYVNGHRRGLIAEENMAPPRAGLARASAGHYEVEALLADLQNRIAKLKHRVAEPARRSRALIDLGIREARRRGWNDTYTFTKWLGEQIACREMQGGTLSIVRPSIVESAWVDPQPGWIEGMKVGDAIVLAYARGRTSLFPARTAGVADIVPVDLVANAIVLAAAQALAQPRRQRIVQVSSGARNPIRVGDYIRLCQAEMQDNARAYPRLIPRPLTRPFRTLPRALFVGYLALAHGAARGASLALRVLGARRNLAALDKLETTRQLAEVFSFYTAPRYVFDNRRLLEMAQEFAPADRTRFQVDAGCFDWPTYIADVHLPGLERFGVREARQPVPEEGRHAAAAPVTRPLESPGT